MNNGRVWIGLVVGLLLLSVGIQAAMIVIASSDPSFALEPEYERKALEWDALKRERQQSEALGWEVKLRALPATTRGQVELRLEAVDELGAAIDDARVHLEGFHNARLGDLRGWELPHQGDGLYSDLLPLQRAGVWEFRVRIERGDDLYVDRFRKSVVTEPRDARQ
ncbi:hypothetical protein ABI59_21715 [Acidobacteria bacterium Mor1]|nr:hypothetical protein ABI59_21715 [Acidobacteria bacterium Mor1]